MKILIANDDGIEAQGLLELTEALSAVAEIYVFAPSEQKSAAGHGISIRTPLTAELRKVKGAREAYAVNGSPADCVKLGLHIMEEKGVDIDMVFSGINHGGNLGSDTLYSGTVSAAIEGNICGKPAVALSVNSHFPDGFEYACDLGVWAAGKFSKALREADEATAKKLRRTTISINVPNIPPEEIKGLRPAVLGPREYTEWFVKEESEKGEVVYKYAGKPVMYDNLPEDYDVMLIQNGYATITPLQYDLTAVSLMNEVSGWSWDPDAGKTF